MDSNVESTLPFSKHGALLFTRCIKTGWMNSWIISTLTMHARNETMWDLTGAQSSGITSSLAAEINKLIPFFLPSSP